MKYKSLWGFVIFALTLNSPKTLGDTLPISPQLIPFSSIEGEQLLIESQAKQDYFLLSNQFVTQVNQAYCGVASSVMVLNALGLPAPESAQYKPFRVFTQENFFDREESKKVISPELVSQRGMTLAS